MRRLSGLLCLVLIGGSIGCTTSPEVSQYQAALRQAATCDEVLDAIQEDAIAKVDLELKSFIDQDYYQWGGPVAFEDVADRGESGRGRSRGSDRGRRRQRGGRPIWVLGYEPPSRRRR